MLAFVGLGRSGLLLMLVMWVTPDVVHDQGDPSVQLFYLDPWPTDPSTQYEARTMEDVCPSDMCENGGTCVMEEGAYRCLCPPAFIGIKCQGIRLDLACDQREMRLQVPKLGLADLTANFSSLQTSSGKCSVVESPLYISIILTHENHTLCGTEVKVNGTHLIYSNVLGSGFSGDLISRSPNIQIAFSCVYRYDQVVSLPYPLLTSASLVTFVVKEGEFNVSMTLHPSADFLDPYNRPPIIPLTGRLYVQLQILGHDPQDFFTLMLEECWATPGLAHTNRIRHPIISSGAANDSTTVMLQSGDRSMSRFSLQMFHFVKFPEFYLHCRVWLYQDNASRCCDQPNTSNSRHIRDLSDPYRKVVSCGPIRLSRSKVSSVGKPESDLSHFILPASSAAAAIFLILGLVTIAKTLKRREIHRRSPLICLTLPPPP